MDPVRVGENNYQVGKLGAIPQFHVMRRLSGVATALGEVVGVIMRAGGVQALLEGKGPDPLESLQPMLRAIGSMTDTDSEFVIYTCLSVVSRQVPGGTGWAPVTSGNQLMYQDIELPHMMVLIWRVLEVNLTSFFSALPSGLPGQGEGGSESGPGSPTTKTG